MDEGVRLQWKYLLRKRRGGGHRGARPEQQIAAPAAKQSRLLLVEDNAVNQRVVLAMLRKKNYAIDVANNGQEALDKLEHATEPIT